MGFGAGEGFGAAADFGTAAAGGGSGQAVGAATPCDVYPQSEDVQLDLSSYSFTLVSNSDGLQPMNFV